MSHDQARHAAAAPTSTHGGSFHGWVEGLLLGPSQGVGRARPGLLGSSLFARLGDEEKGRIERDARASASKGVSWFDACPYSLAFAAQRFHFDAVFFLEGGRM